MSKIVPAYVVVDEFSDKILGVHLDYAEILPFEDGIGIGIIETKTEDGKYKRRAFHIKETGGKLFENDKGHEFVDYFVCDRAAVYDKGKYYFIDKENKVRSRKYDIVCRYKNNYAIVRNEEKYGLIDINGVEVLELKYDHINWDNNVIQVYKGDKQYSITLKGLSEILISFITEWED